MRAAVTHATTPSIASIAQHVASRYGVTVLDLTSDRRVRRICTARQVAMWAASLLTHESITAIGLAFRKDRTTAQHACDRVAERKRRDPVFFNELEALVKSLETVA